MHDVESRPMFHVKRRGWKISPTNCQANVSRESFATLFYRIVSRESFAHTELGKYNTKKLFHINASRDFTERNSSVPQVLGS